MIMPMRGWLAGLVAVAGTWYSLAGAQATQADLEYSLTSPRDPHPITYMWNGEVKPITEPGPNFYHFFYTGTVNDDARVPEDGDIKRVPVSFDEWSTNKRYLIAKLTLFYQLTNNQTPTALKDLSSQPAPEATPEAALPGTAPSTPADPNALGAATPAEGTDTLQDPNAGGGAFNPQGPGGELAPGQFGGAPTQTPSFNTGMPTMPMGGLPPGGYLGGAGGFVGSGGQNAFDPRAAAEWTFYYDQYVLWQYYCGRLLLKNEDELLDPEGGLGASDSSEEGTSGSSSTSPRRGGQTNPLLEQAAKAGPVDSTGSFNEVLANRPQNQGGGAGGRGIGSFIDNQTGDFYSQRGAASSPASRLNQGPGSEARKDGRPTLRQVFNPEADWTRGTPNQEERDRFKDAANKSELELYRSFIEMINRIDEREVNNEKYDEWLQAKRQQVFNFSDSWRQLSEGDSKIIDDRLFLITDEPLESVPNDAINVQRAAQLTPQDLLNGNGELKHPEND